MCLRNTHDSPLHRNNLRKRVENAGAFNAADGQFRVTIGAFPSSRKKGISLNISQKKRRITVLTLPPFRIPAPAPTTCKVHGCRTPSHGRSFCHKHAQKGKENGIIFSTEQRVHMRSLCCSAACTAGKQHEYGNQYCQECKEACCWHM